MSGACRMTWRDRIVNDGTDRESWKEARKGRIGASDAGKFAKLTSVESYVRAKLAPSFSGNASTDSGNDWEPALLAATGFEANKALIRHPDEPGFVATPDGIREDASGLHLAEIKTKHMQVVTGPKPHEVRQMAFQLHVFPEAVDVTFVWGEIVPDAASPVGWKLRRPPQHLVFYRDDPRIVAATSLIVPIAVAVLERLDAARRVAVPF